MNTRHVRAIVILVAALMAACDRHQPEEPTGEMRTETREVAHFSAIDMRGDARLIITVGDTASLTVEGRESVLPHVTTAVRGETLHISSRRRDWLWADGDARATLRITVPQLRALSLHGGNEVRLTGFAGGESRIEVEGAASIHADGRLDELTVHVAGAGHADFSKLVADEATVSVDGVGSVLVNSKESLNATMNGVGAIHYIGEPRKVNTKMNGFGTIGRKDATDDPDPNPDPDPDPDPELEIDPEKLQPEYDKDPAVLEQLKKIKPTEAI